MHQKLQYMLYRVGPDLVGRVLDELFDSHVVRAQLGPCHGPKPYKFIRFGIIHGPKPYKFIGFGTINGPKPYKFIGFGTIHGV